jgi:hypothetical protein
MKLTYDIQKIEDTLAEYVKDIGLSNKIFKGQRPNNVDTGMSDFVVVSVPSSINDREVYGECICRIEMFVKNLSNGTKNGVKFSLMYKKLCDTFPIESDTYIFDVNPNMIQLGNDKNGYFAQAINIKTIIKTL